MKKIGLLCLALILAVGSLGIGYAMWSDTITISGTAKTGTLDWEFQGPLISGDPCVPPTNDLNCFYDLYDGTWQTMTKSVACTDMAISSPDTLDITVHNAYPFYGNHIAFVVKDLGTIPLKIWKLEFYRDGTLIDTTYAENKYVYLDYDGDGAPEIQLWWGDGFGLQMHQGDKHDVSFMLLVLEPADQNITYNFSMKLIAVQWNEYSIP